MLKKIISLVLVVCMMATMAISVSADAADSAITAVISEVAQDGTFTVTFYVTPNDEADLQGYAIAIEFDDTQLANDSSWKKGKVFGDLDGTKEYNTEKSNSLKAVWANTGGLINSDEEKIAADATGNIPLCVYKLKIVDNEANYGNEATITYDIDTSLLSDGNAKITNVPASGSFVMPDNRPEIEGLTATAVEGLAYTGEAIDPATTVTLNTVDGDEVTYKSEPAEIKAAGTYKVTATVKRAGCKATDVSADVVVAPKAITATVANATKVYGDADPAFTATAEGLVGEDTLTYEFTRAAGEDVGTYAINATATNANYAVTVVPGELEITKKAITVTMADASMTYGDALPEFTSDAPAGVTITPTVAEKPNAGTVEITATAESANYDVTVVPGTLTVAKKAITITAQYEFQVEGNGIITEFKPAIVEGLVEGDEITNIVVGFKGEYTDAEGVYAVEVKSYDENANYEVTKVDGVYEIKSALPVVVTFGENKKTYGDADGEIVVSGDVDKVTIVRKEAEAAGTYEDAYEVTLKVDTDAETGLPYALTVENNVFVIEKKVVTIKAKDEKQTLGKGLLTTFKAAEVIGEVEGDEITEIVVGFKGEYADVEGTFAVEIKSYVASDNYIVNTEDGVYTIKKGGARPSGGGSVVKPATKPEDKEDVKDDETDKPAASANIVLKENAKEIKFIEGFEDKTFRPDDNATRNDVVSALTALFDVTDVKNAPTFNDTDDAAIKALAAAGVINGYEDGSFKGYNDVTRAEFVKLIAAALKLEAVEGAEANFSDIEGHWAAEWIKTFVGKGYLVGYPDGTFRPDDKITRAEMVVVITRVVGTVDAEAAINFADVDDSHWAYDYIMKAAK